MPASADAGHVAVLRHMVKHLFRGEPLLCPGVEGRDSLELINAMLLSRYLGQSVGMPVDRSRYDAFPAERVVESIPKAAHRADGRETDPCHG